MIKNLHSLLLHHISKHIPKLLSIFFISYSIIKVCPPRKYFKQIKDATKVQASFKTDERELHVFLLKIQMI